MVAQRKLIVEGVTQSAYARGGAAQGFNLAAKRLICEGGTREP